METSIIDQLFLELSQFTQATTARELALQRRIDALAADLEETRRQLSLLEHRSGLSAE